MGMSLPQREKPAKRVADRDHRVASSGTFPRLWKRLVLGLPFVATLGSVATAGVVTPFTAVGNVTNAVTGQSGTITYDGSFEQTYLGENAGFSYSFSSTTSENVVVPEWVIKAITAKLIADTTPSRPPPSPPPPFPPPPSPPRSIAEMTGNNFAGSFAVAEPALTMAGSLTVTPSQVSVAYDCTFHMALPSFTGALAGSFTATGRLQPKSGSAPGATETTAMMLSTFPLGPSVQDVLPIDLSIDLSWDPSYGVFPYSQTIDVAFDLTEAIGSWTATGGIGMVSVPEIDGASSGLVIGMVGAAMMLLEGRRCDRRRSRSRDVAV